MKNKFAILTLTIAIVGAAVTSCGKYEDGPAFTLLTKKARVVGEWDLQETLHSDGTVSYDNSTSTMELTEDEEAFFHSGNITVEGTWDFTNNKENLRLESGSFSGTYEIRRLKSREMWLKDVNSGDIMKYENID